MKYDAGRYVHPGHWHDGYVWLCDCGKDLSTANRFPDCVVVFLEILWEAHSGPGHRVRVYRPELEVRPEGCRCGIQAALTVG